MIKTYAQIHDADKASVGGKASAVAKLAQAGLPIPKGFSITSVLTRKLTEGDERLQQTYASYLNSLGQGSEQSHQAAEELEDAIAKISLPSKTASRLSNVRQEMFGSEECRLIVRSSASVEDSITISFAVQFMSAVVPNTDKALIAGMKQCWQALASPSLAAYAHAMKVQLSTIGLAFLVQQFIEFDYSGVLFTRAPGDSNRGDYLVEYAEGAAEKVVAGRVIPARCRLVHGTEAVDWLNQPIHVSQLPNRTLIQLGRLATRAKKVFFCDQDIEWGLLGSDIFILQSRPITA